MLQNPALNLVVKKIHEIVLSKDQVNIQVEELIAKYEATNEKFVDKDFPPGMNSLMKRNQDNPKWKKFVWRRATEFLDEKEIKIFDDIQPNDILQGQLGDCYFLCCLSAIAEKPLIVKRLFLTEVPNKAGCYSVWLNDNGEWKEIIVDDYFPCSGSDKGPAFSKSNGNELWVLILEKAYAKMHGGYDIIEGGHPSLALRDLTGAPYDFFESSNPDEVWDYLIKANEKDYLMTCYTKSTDIREEQTPLGIVFGHAYSILDVKKIQLPNDAEERLIQIRNPWGKFEWKGDWGDSSPLWTEEIKSQVNYRDADDGTFWMSVTDFVKYYEGTGICKFHSDYRYKSIQFNHAKTKKNHSIVRIHVNEPTHIFLSLNQKDDRCFDVNQNYKYSLCRMMIGKITPNGLEYLGGDFYNDRNLVIELNNIEEGTYIVALEMIWYQNFYQRFNLSTYSNSSVNLEEVANADLMLIQRNLVKSYLLLNQSTSNDTIKCKDFKQQGESEIKKYWGLFLGMAYFYYINHSANKRKLIEKVTMVTLENLKICPPEQNDMYYEIALLPNDDKLVLYKCQKAGDSYTFSTKTSSSLRLCANSDIEHNNKFSYSSTVYHDDPNDKIIYQNAKYDKFIRKDSNPKQEDKKQEVIENIMRTELKIDPAKYDTTRYQSNHHNHDFDNPNLHNHDMALEVNTALNQNMDTPLISKSADITALETWANIPKSFKDNGDSNFFIVQEYEINYINIVEPILETSELKIYLPLFFLICYLILPIAIHIMSSDILDLIFGWGLALLLLLKGCNIKILYNHNALIRLYPYILMITIFIDIYYAIVHTLKENESKALLIISYIELFTKPMYTLLFWYQSIQVLR